MQALLQRYSELALAYQDTQGRAFVEAMCRAAQEKRLERLLYRLLRKPGSRIVDTNSEYLLARCKIGLCLTPPWFSFWSQAPAPQT